MLPNTSSSTSPAGDVMALAGRLLIAYLFVPTGWGVVMNFSRTVGYIAKYGVPFPEVCAAIAIAAELGLGLFILLGLQTRLAALGLALFIFVITPIFHNYWAVEKAQVMAQQINFEKNLAIAGGLLILAAFGAGRLSLDGRRRERVGGVQAA